MQLSRVAIAAVFFVVGALIVLPMFMNSSSPSRAASGTPSPSVAVSATASGPTKASASASPSHRPTATHTTTRPPSTPPAPSVTPLVPLKVKIGSVRCPGRGVQVSVINGGKQTEDYAIITDGSIAVADRIPAGATRRSTVNVKEDRTTTIAVTLHNVPVKSLDRKANCVHKISHGTLPHTGPDSGLIYARIATGIAAMLTGVIIFWYGRLWPRRRGKMFDDAP